MNGVTGTILFMVLGLGFVLLGTGRIYLNQTYGNDYSEVATIVLLAVGNVLIWFALFRKGAKRSGPEPRSPPERVWANWNLIENLSPEEWLVIDVLKYTNNSEYFQSMNLRSTGLSDRELELVLEKLRKKGFVEREPSHRVGDLWVLTAIGEQLRKP